MNKDINQFVDTLFRGHGNNKELRELKMEINQHLSDSVKDLMDEGYEEASAVKLAIEKFGGDSLNSKVLKGLFIQQKLFASKLLLFSIGTLLLSVMIFFLMTNFNEKLIQQQSTIASNILTMVQDEESINNVHSDRIKELVEESNIKEIEVFRIIKPSNNIEEWRLPLEPALSYERNDFFSESLMSYFEGSLASTNWHLDLKYSHFSTLTSLLLIAGISIYWTLFTIWGVITVSHTNSSVIKWGFIFVLFNALGLLLFCLYQKTSKNN
ncbi:permease prefix domain 1-containing protein (plasmid) [Alkalihalophilus sp. As8PL]|uniref:Permease prefix domain 1-containing protein n=1 Tax=Alkalihalophilus sp. As8PL TaxID=3237103 RepID=A0AB39BNU3_9BACI